VTRSLSACEGLETAGRAIPSTSLQLTAEMPLASLWGTLPQPLCELQPKAEEGLGPHGDSKMEAHIPITKCSLLRKRHLDAVLSPRNTYHRSAEIGFLPAAFPVRRNRGSERAFCIQPLVLQAMPPSGFVPHSGVALSESKLFAVCKIKDNKVGSELKCCAPVCLGRGAPRLNPACPRPKPCDADLWRCTE